MAEDKKVTDLTEQATAPDNSWLHFVNPDDVDQDPEGSSYKISKINFLKEITAEIIKSAPFLGSIVPTSTPTNTTNAYWLATQAGTYTNFGSVVVASNSLAVISVVDGAYSISKTTFSLTSYALNGGSTKTLLQVENEFLAEIKEATYNTATDGISTSGYFVSNIGVNTSSANFNKFEFVPVSGESYYADGVMYGTNVSLAVYLSSTGSVISTQFSSTGNTNQVYSKQLLTIPTSTAKVVINTYVPASSIALASYITYTTSKFYAKSETYSKTEVDSKLTTINNAVFSTENEYVVDDNSVLEEGYFYTSAGAKSASSSTNWQNIMTTYNSAKEYYVDGSTFTASTALVIFFNGTTFLGYQSIGVAGTVTNYSKTKVVVPTNTTRFSVTSYKVSGNLAKVYYSSGKAKNFYTKTESDAKYLAGSSFYNNVDKNTNLKQINYIPIFGQSLSVGAESVPVLSTVQKYNSLMMNTGVIKASGTVANFTSFQSLVEANYETAASGASETIIELIKQLNSIYPNSAFYDNFQLAFGSHGVGSKTITDLQTDYLAGFTNAVQGAKNIATGLSKTINVPCWVWIQGESDLRGVDATSLQSRSAYKTKLIELHEAINTAVKAITGQTNDLKCILYQTGNVSLYSQVFNFEYPYTGVPQAQLELNALDTRFIPSTPTYILDFHKGTNIHLTNISEKLLGAYNGVAIKKSIIDLEDVKPVYPKLITITGNVITVQFHVPNMPLVFDTSWIKSVSNYGFDVVTTANSHIISSVSVLGDTVTINCYASPLNAKLRYAINGETVDYSTLSYVTGMSGRIDGARGNLRDSQGLYYKKNIEGIDYPLHNYAHHFDVLLSSSSIANFGL